MDHIVVKEYVLVYFHTLTSEYNHLDSDFLKKLCDVVDVKWVILPVTEGAQRLSPLVEAGASIAVYSAEVYFMYQRPLPFVV